jgi:hypothetical protein
MTVRSSHRPTRRGVLGLIAGGVLAITGGRLAKPAAAKQRPEAKGANDFIDFCFRSGGDPIVLDYPDGSVIVICQNLPNSGDYQCTFTGNSQDCWIRGLTQPGPYDNLPVFETDGAVLVPATEFQALTTDGAAKEPASTPKKRKKRARRRTRRR